MGASGRERMYQRYAAKFRAETVRAEPPTPLASTDENLARICSSPWLARPATTEDFPGIRRALAEWSTEQNGPLVLFEVSLVEER